MLCDRDKRRIYDTPGPGYVSLKEREKFDQNRIRRSGPQFHIDQPAVLADIPSCFLMTPSDSTCDIQQSMARDNQLHVDAKSVGLENLVANPLRERVGLAAAREMVLARRPADDGLSAAVGALVPPTISHVRCELIRLVQEQLLLVDLSRLASEYVLPRWSRFAADGCNLELAARAPGACPCMLSGHDARLADHARACPKRQSSPARFYSGGEPSPARFFSGGGYDNAYAVAGCAWPGAQAALLHRESERFELWCWRDSPLYAADCIDDCVFRGVMVNMLCIRGNPSDFERMSIAGHGDCLVYAHDDSVSVLHLTAKAIPSTDHVELVSASTRVIQLDPSEARAQRNDFFMRRPAVCLAMDAASGYFCSGHRGGPIYVASVDGDGPFLIEGIPPHWHALHINDDGALSAHTHLSLHFCI